jgi:hypothetical protein
LRKVIAIIITLIVILTGCSNGNNSASNTVQIQPQPESTSQSAKDTNSNTDSSIIDNIDTSKSLFEKGYYDYEGSINDNMSIQMSIYPLGKDIVGSYFYESQKKEINLKGKAGAEDIVLYEYDETGKHTGIFKGKMTTVDKIEGTWISADNKVSYPFKLSLKSIIPGAEYEKRYAVAVGTLSDQDVENFASKIQGYVINDDKQQLAEVIAYPINVKINDKVTKIQNKDDFIKSYDKIFHSNYKQAISNASTKYMFANWQGVMFGEGLYNVWINEVTSTEGSSKLMITAINN